MYEDREVDVDGLQELVESEYGRFVETVKEVGRVGSE